MSLKKIPASTPCRRTGWSVSSLAISGSRQESSMATPARRSRYSGRERPACRMNQTGVLGAVPVRSARAAVLSPRNALTRGDPLVCPVIMGCPAGSVMR